MKKNHWIYAVSFSVVLIICIFGISRWNMLYLRDVNNHEFNHEDFYELEPDCVDVLFVGSSHAYCAFIPAKMYEDYHISSYTLATSNQSMLANYLWAKEAYERQHYKVLVVEAMSVPMSHGDVINDIRSLSSMGNSPHYYELVKTYKRECLKVLFPVIAFHAEWERIGISNYQKNVFEEACGARGFYPVPSFVAEEDVEDIIDEDDDSIGYLKYPYMDALREFCDKNGIKLMMVKTPIANARANYWDTGIHNNLAQYTEEHGIPFFDFNLEPLQQETGIFPIDTVAADGRHCNIDGAEKITAFVGEYIRDNYGIVSEDGTFSEEDLKVYHEYIQAYLDVANKNKR